LDAKLTSLIPSHPKVIAGDLSPHKLLNYVTVVSLVKIAVNSDMALTSAPVSILKELANH